jgi:small subunit ribosomal protein S17
MKTLTGKVISAKVKNTIIVEIEKNRVHPLYKKIMRRTRNYKVHYDEKGANPGDMVTIVETRPISKDKFYKLVKVIKSKVKSSK